jgi:hypothetical protein
MRGAGEPGDAAQGSEPIAGARPMALNRSMRAQRATGRSINATMMAPPAWPATGRKSGTGSMGDADTFVLATALGLAGLPAARRTRASLILAAFEAGMPVAGVLGGPGADRFPGSSAGYTAAAVIGLAALLALRPGQDEEKERNSSA